MLNIPDYPIDQDITIEPQDTWPGSVHLFRPDTVAALRAAEATGRPLLVRGLPGVGKSETARAAAAFAKRPFLSLVIDGRTEPDDLKWRVDAVKRLSDAQAHRALDERHYVRPDVLWWAFDWKDALEQERRARGDSAPERPRPAKWQVGQDRAVLLIDEIDKADPDLPNALLEVLANRGFTPPFADAQPVCCSEATRPLILITTNEERELPAAFLRRCLVLTLELPKGPALRRELIRLAQRHQEHRVVLHGRQPAAVPQGGGRCLILDAVADEFLRLRASVQAGDYMPGTSEFLDLVNALATLYPDDEARQKQALTTLSQFVWKSLRSASGEPSDADAP